MKLTKTILFVSLLAGSTQLAAASDLPRRFQLNCSGETTIISSGGIEKSATETVIQVNRDSEVWCRENCKHIQKINFESEKELVFRNISGDEGKEFGSRFWYFVFDKQDRTMYEFSMLSQSAVAFSGTCEVGPYQP